MAALDSICSQAMLAMNQLAESDKSVVAIDADFLSTLCQGYIMLYHKLMDHKAMPTPKNQRRFHQVYH
jgi:hypothetical protein